MSIYTKSGDKGTTDLVHTKNVSKSDDRIQLEGTIDELVSHIGLVKASIRDGDTSRFLEKIQETLLTVMSGVADPYNREYKINDDKTELLEEEIDRLEKQIGNVKPSVIPGVCPLSAEIDVTRTVARRAERALAVVSVKFGSDTGTKKYMNRLGDYFYVLARAEERKAEKQPTAAGGTGAMTAQEQAKENMAEDTAVHAGVSGGTVQDMNSMVTEKAGNAAAIHSTTADSPAGSQQVDEAIIQAVLRKMGIQGRITLDSAKKLIEKIEQEALRRGKRAVIAICGPDGNPIAVHVMDGAFLVSFDVALKKAYTSVAVKMSTMELSRLAQPGGTFYGVDKMDGGKIVIFGGGVPLKSGDTIIGGLGISGGTGEEDHSLAEYGLSVLPEIL